MFHPGQQVICIDDRFHSSIVEWGDDLPQIGQVYTIKRINPFAPHALTRELGVGLVLLELANPGDRLCFSAWRFREFCEETCAEQVEVAEATMPL
jgi:hypothetical protein